MMEYLHGYYQSPLVLVSILVAVLASYTALNMAARVSQASVHAARWWILGGALAMGTGIWSMHFIGMLAFRLPIPLGYDFTITMLSWLLPVAVSALALWQLGGNPNSQRLGASAVLFGLGINAMHFVGMLAMRIEPGIIWDPLLVATSIVIAAGAAGLALWIAFALRKQDQRTWIPRALAALVMGAAIAGMHYTGMAAASFPQGSVCRAAVDGFSLDALAVTVAVATFSVLAIALLTSVFDARLEARAQVLTMTQDLVKERQQLLENERAAREEVERVSRMKDEFLATLSHELRTPLNSILGWAQLLQLRSQDETVQQAAATIDRNARMQSQLIDDLLDMSRIIAGKVRLDLRLVEPQVVLRAAIEMAQPAAAAKRIRLSLFEGLVSQVRIDPDRFQQVMWNLLSNAIKFTPEHGHVQVKLTESAGLVHISVVDNGVGIAPDFLPHVFERFRQADGSTTRRQGGLGIGLSIVRQLVELHGGKVTANSAGPGRGASFTVSIPVALSPDQVGSSGRHAEPNRLHEEPAPELAGVHVLVVDDEDDAREVVRQMLLQCGARVSTAASATDALIMLNERVPDLLLSDIAMPGRDGFDLIRAIRHLGAPTRELPAIALTAFGHADDRSRALSAGFDLHLSKPVELGKLAQAISGLLHARRAATSGQAPG